MPLPIIIPSSEMYDEVHGTFVNTREQTLQLEHSLISLSRWESKWHKPFLSKKVEKTREEIEDYIRCMTTNANIDPKIYKCLTKENYLEIDKYINDPMTATTIHDVTKSKASRETLTSELLYYYMIASNIPFECEKWHLNRLIMLIRVCAVKNETPKKMSKKDIMSRNAALNAKRKQQLNTKG